MYRVAADHGEEPARDHAYGKKIKGVKNISGLYLSKAWDHFDLNQMQEAERWTDTMLAYDIKNDIGGYMMTLSQAAELYEGTGNTEKAKSPTITYATMIGCAKNIFLNMTASLFPKKAIQ